MDRWTSLLLGSLLLGGPAIAGSAGPDAPRRDRADTTVLPPGPMLGVHIQELSPLLQEHLGVPELGVMVREIVPGSAAEAAKVAVGDVLVAVGGAPVADLGTLREAVHASAGARVAVVVVRDGELHTLDAVLPASAAEPRLAAAPSTRYEAGERPEVAALEAQLGALSDRLARFSG